MTFRSTAWTLLAAGLLGIGSAACAATAAHTGTAASAPAAGHPAMPQRKAAAPRKLVDINSASLAELKTLPGIGDKEAQAIIAGRPYKTKADLVYKKVLPEGPYVSVRRHVIAVQKAPKGKPQKAKAG